MTIFNFGDLDRRDFLKRFGAALAGVTILGAMPTVLESCSGTGIDIGPGSDAGQSKIVDVASLTTDNTAIHSTAPSSNRPLLVLRRNATTYETLLLVCPHEGCSYPNVDLQSTSIVCSCHTSVYDLSGGRVSGPTPSGLTSFATTFDAMTKKVTITF